MFSVHSNFTKKKKENSAECQFFVGLNFYKKHATNYLIFIAGFFYNV